MNRIEIPSSRGKLILITLVSLLFVVCGVFIGYLSTLYTTLALELLAVAAAVIGFSGMCGIYGFIKLFDLRPGMVIDSEGIHDHSSAIGPGLIRWGDILEIRRIRMGSQDLLQVFVPNPEDYIRRANRFQRFWMRLNLKFYGSPLGISTNGLKCNLAELEEWLNARLPKGVTREDG